MFRIDEWKSPGALRPLRYAEETQDIFDVVCRSESLTELRDDHVEFRHNIWFRLNLQGRDEIFHGMFTQDFRQQFRVDDSTLWRFCCSHCGLSIDQYSPPEN